MTHFFKVNFKVCVLICDVTMFLYKQIHYFLLNINCFLKIWLWGHPCIILWSQIITFYSLFNFWHPETFVIFLMNTLYLTILTNRASISFHFIQKHYPYLIQDVSFKKVTKSKFGNVDI